VKPERWERIKELFAEALRLDGADREELLERECGLDHELRREIEELLQGHMRTDEFMRPRWLPELPDFEIIRELGSGGMGVVYLARQKSLDRLVAIKVMRGHLGSSAAEIADFRREPAKAAKLEHPNIARIHMVGSEAEVPYFVMEYVPGRSLKDVLTECHPPAKPGGEITSTHAFGRPGASYVSRVAQVVLEIADALQYSHEHGLVHRDIKPGNVLIDAGGHPHLVDFGIAKALDSETLTSRVMGTPFYMSPEQAHIAEIKVDHRTDVYSLGVVLYEMLTLQRPFERETFTQVFAAIREFDPPPVRRRNPDVPVDLQTICHKAIRKEPKNRYASAGDLAEDLRRFLDHRPPLGQPETFLERAQRRLSRHRVPVAWAATLLLTLTITMWATGAFAAEGIAWITLDAVPRGLEVEYRATPLDEVSGLPLEDADPIELGTGPLEERTLRAGYYSITAQSGELFGETVVNVKVGDRRALPTLTLKTTEEATNGMVLIPPGLFTPGVTRPDVPTVRDPVRIGAFYVDPFEVTNAQYREFVEATGYAAPEAWPEEWNSAWDDRPVAYVTPRDAEAFAAWAGKRIPLHLEWRRVAGGPDDANYPWGDSGEELSLDDVKERANVGKLQQPKTWDAFVQNVEPVGSRPGDVTAEGVHDLYGNVAEWTTGFGVSSVPETGELILTGDLQPLCGAAWSYEPILFPQYRPAPIATKGPTTGFRCVRSARP